MVRNIGGYLSTLMDRVAIGGATGTTAMGHYHVALDVATSPSKELVGPLASALFPVMARVQNDLQARRELYLDVLYWTALISTSTAVGVALVSDDMVDLVLGPQWAAVKPLMAWLALSYGLLGMGNSVYLTLDNLGLPWLAARLQWTRLLTTMIIMFPVAYYFRDLEAVAAGRLFVAIVITPTLFGTIMQPLGLTVSHFVVALWRPLVSGIAMAAVVLALNNALPFTGNLRLIIDMAVGAASYAGTLMILWALVGRPKGPELLLWNRASTVFWPM
jgi:lipopolysaccharide exporter